MPIDGVTGGRDKDGCVATHISITGEGRVRGIFWGEYSKTDSSKANTTSKTEQNLPYPLLCDPSAILMQAIGFKKAPKGTQRGVFVVDKESKLLAIEAGSPAATVEFVNSPVEKMGGDGKDEGLEKTEKTAVEGEEKDRKVADVVKGLDGTPSSS